MRWIFVNIMGLLFCMPALAATNGEVGTQSTGRVLIQLTIKQSVQITNLEDIEIVVDEDTGHDVVASRPFCVRGNKGGQYSLMASNSQGGSSEFALTSMTNDTVDFELYFSGELGDQVGDRLLPNDPSPTYTITNSDPNCDGDDNAELRLVIPSSNINNALDEEYRGSLYLTVATE